MRYPPADLRLWVTTHKLRDREWLYFPPLHIYVRLANRYLGPNNTVVPTLDLSNMSVDEDQRGKGIMTAFAAQAEALADELGLYVFVESIQEERFAKFWERRGYVIEDPSHIGIIVNAYRPPKAKP